MRRVIQFIIAVSLFCFAFWGVTYTADWAGYEMYFDNGMDIKEDIGSIFLFTVLKDYGFDDYRVAFRVHIFLMGLFFPLLYIKLGLNPIPYTVLLVVFTYVPLANQIRYYVAFPAAILSLIYYTEKRYLISIAFVLLAFAFHRTTLILAILLLFYDIYTGRHYSYSRHNKYVSYGLLAGFVFLLVLYPRLGSRLGDYSSYTNESQVSSVLGGLYNLIPCLLGVGTVLFYNRLVNRYHTTIISYNCLRYRQLILLSVATCILIPISLRMQILNSRMVLPFFTIWIAFLVYIQRTGKRLNKNVSTSGVVFFLIAVMILHQTILPYLLGLSEVPISMELLLTLSSYHF